MCVKLASQQSTIVMKTRKKTEKNCYSCQFPESIILLYINYFGLQNYHFFPCSIKRSFEKVPSKFVSTVINENSVSILNIRICIKA